MSRIVSARAHLEAVKLTRPYTIARGTIDAVHLVYFELRDDQGRRGLGAASPAPEVTGETFDACVEHLAAAEGWLRGEDPRHFGRLRALARRPSATESPPSAEGPGPAALAALDMALLDLHGHCLGVPAVDLLGVRRHEPLPTSITVGIQSTESALEEVDEYLARGFRCLKIKIGHDFDQDRDRLRRLRERAGPGVALRVDGNQGYGPSEAAELLRLVDEIGLELVEQPLPRQADAEQAALPTRLRQVSAADESLHHFDDALRLATGDPPFAIFNIKLMKCGGPSGALDIARVADARGISLMWGCNDESVISIAAALHTAWACPATRYLDLDGSFDLAADLAEGGFELRAGMLYPLDAPGLGVRLARDPFA